MRMFFALWPDEPVRAACAERARRLLAEREPGGKAVPAARLHLTLHFLGEVDATRLDAARHAAAGLAVAPCELLLDCAGSFRGRGMPCWLGATRPPAELVALHAALGERLRDSGFAVDQRGWQPHLTVARNNRRQLRRAPIEPVRWPVREFVLVESVLGESGGYRIAG